MKRLKLRKEVKVITTLLCFGLLCTAVPTINAVAEDTGTEDNTVETNTVDETTTEETVTDDTVVEEPIVEEVELPETDLYTRLMNTTTVEEFDAIVNAATDEEFSSFTDEQLRDIDLLYSSFEKNEDSSDEVICEKVTIVTDWADEVIVPSETINPTVNFTEVAPLVNYEDEE